MGKSRFIAGPARTMTTRFQRACASKVRWRSSGRIGSLCLLSSSIFTKPPKGKRPTQYSVSLPRMRRTFGPKPIEKVSTLTPKILAKAKCPDSWMKMSELTRMTKYRRSTVSPGVPSRE